MKDTDGRSLTAFTCQSCGAEFHARLHDILHRGRRSCSRTCAQRGSKNGNYKGGTVGSEYTQKYTKRDPEKHNCRRLLVNAIRRGHIERKPCFICGDVKADGHHYDYAKPYDVFWLCRRHHTDVHKKLIELPLPSTPIIPAV